MELLFQHTVDELNLLLFLQLRAVFRNLLTTSAAGIALRLLFAITHFRRADAECTALPGDGLLIDSHVLQSSFVCLHATALGRTAAVMRNRRHVLNHAHVQTSGLQGADGGFTAGTRTNTHIRKRTAPGSQYFQA